MEPSETRSAEPIIIVLSGDDPRSTELAGQLGLVCCEQPPDDAGFALEYQTGGLSLCNLQQPMLKPIRVGFTEGKTAYRRNQPELIVKATAIGKRDAPKVLDATAGMGQDGFILASRNCHVTLIERNPIIAALLADGLERASLHPETSMIRERIRLLNTDSADWMADNPERFDCIYLDPMFPEKKKQAAAKKEMQFFQKILETGDYGENLLLAALSANSPRVVVKRPVKASPLGGNKPDFYISGRSIRFDVYINHAKLKN